MSHTSRLTRRAFLKFSASGVLGLSSLRGMSALADVPAGAERRFKPVIMLFLSGGPSRQETFDPCTPDTPVEFRGELRRVETSIRGVYYSELFPKLAARADQCAILRGLDSESGDHFDSARKLMMDPSKTTLGVRWGEKAAWGGVPYLFAQVPSTFPPMDAFSTQAAFNLTWKRAKEPVGTFGTEWEKDLASEGAFVGPELRKDPRMADRVKLLEAFDTARVESPSAKRMEANYKLALELLGDGGGAFAEAFKPSAKEEKRFNADLERYGKSIVGRGLLLARRLVERGAGFVVVYNERGAGWDTHSDMYPRMRVMAPEVDASASALIDDIKDGRLECVFTVLGEFGRTPKINSSAGRDHWGEGYPAIFCGHGVRTGIVHGRTHHTGKIIDGRVLARDFAPTLIQLAGGEEFISPATQRVREIIRG